MRAICAQHGAADDAEDGAQELVVKLLPGIASGRIPPKYGEEDAFLKRCARNEARDILKGKGVRYQHRRFGTVSVAHTLTEDPFGHGERPDELDARKAALREVLPDLHDRYREVIEAHHFQGLQLKDIAERWYREGQAETLQKAKYVVQKAHQNGMNRLRLLLQARLREAKG